VAQTGREKVAQINREFTVAGRVREFTPLRPAMEPWGEEI